MRRLLIPAAIGVLLLSACGNAGSTTPTATTGATATTQSSTSDVTSIKNYLIDKATSLKKSSEALKSASDRYFALAKDAKFDYAALWSTKRDDVTKAIQDTRTAWEAASPTYEKMEGIVAGVEPLSKYDVILDAGTSGAEGGDNVVPFDLTLPDGRVLSKPGNLFGVTEMTLWGTAPEYEVKDVQADYNGDGKVDFGEKLPDANVLKGSVDALDQYAGELLASGQAWSPTAEDGFNALLANVPTVSDFFESWKNSRFVMGDASEQRDFVVISRLSDITDNVSSWQAIYSGLSASVRAVDATGDAQITKGLDDLKAYVGGLYSQEQGGKRFTPEEADILSRDAQDRATAIAGQIAQAAAQLNIKVQE